MIEKSVMEPLYDSIERFTVSCDSCAHNEDYTTKEGWLDLMKQIREDGWVSRKLGDLWEHYCSACQEGAKP